MCACLRAYIMVELYIFMTCITNFIQNINNTKHPHNDGTCTEMDDLHKQLYKAQIYIYINQLVNKNINYKCLISQSGRFDPLSVEVCSELSGLNSRCVGGGHSTGQLTD